VGTRRVAAKYLIRARRKQEEGPDSLAGRGRSWRLPAEERWPCSVRRTCTSLQSDFSRSDRQHKIPFRTSAVNSDFQMAALQGMGTSIESRGPNSEGSHTDC
jgi:hypothetical protein